MVLINIKSLNKDNIYKNIKNTVIYKGKEIGVGQYIFNEILGDKYIEKYGIVDFAVGKKRMTEIMDNLSDLYRETPHIVTEKLDRIKQAGYMVGTVLSPPLTIDDIAVYEEFDILRKKIEKETNDEKRFKLEQELRNSIEAYIKKNNLTWDTLLNAGAGANMSQIGQLLGVRGTLTDANNNISAVVSKPIAGGLSPIDLFRASSESRKGIADRALNTATTGYLERKLVYAMGSLILDFENEDCGTERTFSIKLTKSIKSRILGRFMIVNKSKILITPQIVNRLREGSTIELRSPIFCRTHKVCKTCYGNLGLINKTEFIGILAGTTIG